MIGNSGIKCRGGKVPPGIKKKGAFPRACVVLIVIFYKVVPSVKASKQSLDRKGNSKQ